MTSPRFVAISAGTDHLLALTSSGRAFAHPISKMANSHGQLGFRKFDIPVQSSETIPIKASPSRLPVELTPKIATDLYAKASASSRPATPSSDILQLFDDENIRFSDTLFEIPGLKGIKVAQVVAAGRTSFVKTDTGKVLGWGANENA
jgi:alpha-tubulin suppressor-like RCC1 family protein